MKMKPILAFAILFALALPAAAQTSRPPYERTAVAFFVPAGVPWEEQRHRLNFPRTAVVEDDGQGLVRFNGYEWPAGELARTQRCRASGPVFEKKQNRMRFIVDCPQEWLKHFFIPTDDMDTALKLLERFVARGKAGGPEERAIQEKLASRAAAALFAGDLAPVPEPKRLSIMKAVTGLGASAVRKTTYRDLPYLEVDLGVHGNVFNTIQLNRTQRVARVVLDQMIPAARRLDEELAGIDPIAGLTLKVAVSYRNFVTPQNGESGIDTVELFLPRGEIAKHRRDEITSQQLIASGVVRVNDNRVDVDLAQQ